MIENIKYKFGDNNLELVAMVDSLLNNFLYKGFNDGFTEEAG